MKWVNVWRNGDEGGEDERMKGMLIGRTNEWEEIQRNQYLSSNFAGYMGNQQ
jgi:hypothetical protein